MRRASDRDPVQSAAPMSDPSRPDDSDLHANLRPKSALAAEDLDDATPRTSRLLHPGTIAMIIVLLLLATCAISNVRDRVQRSALEQALAPLHQEWAVLREHAGARLASIEALLGTSEPPREDGCAALTGTISVIHRPMLTELAAGTSAPRPGPLWLNSDAWLYLALALTPGRDVDAHRRRNEAVLAATTDPCIGILEAEQAEQARAVDAHRFAGGEVSGRLRVVCVDDPRIACEVVITSQPTFAVSVVQRDSRVQDGADAAAVDDAAIRAYWRAIDAALGERAPGLRALHAP